MKSSPFSFSATRNTQGNGLSRRDFGLAFAASALTAGMPAMAQSAFAFPSKPITIVAPFTPGGALDLIARGVAQRLQAQMGGSAVVDNRVGASGIIGSQHVMRSSPDGYTLLLGSTTTHGINPRLYKKPTYDPIKDFTAVSLVATIPHVLLVSSALPVHNLKELLAYAKANPGMAFGSAGIGSPHHLAGEMLRSATKIDIIHVP